MLLPAELFPELFLLRWLLFLLPVQRWLPAGLAIVDEAFTEQNGLVNSTMKVVRSRVEEHFRDRLDALYTPEGKRPDSAQNLASLKKLVE